MGVRSSLLAIPVTAFDTQTMNAVTFTAAAAPFPQAISFLRIVNTADSTVEISYDGVTIHDVVEELGSIEVPAASLGIPQNNTSLLKKGTVVYVRGTAAEGSLYVIGYYQPQ